MSDLKVGDTVRLISWAKYKKTKKGADFEGAWLNAFFKIGWGKAIIAETYKNSSLVKVVFKKFGIFKIILLIPKKLLNKINKKEEVEEKK